MGSSKYAIKSPSKTARLGLIWAITAVLSLSYPVFNGNMAEASLNSDSVAISTILLEARGESYNGQIGVAEVIRNRAKKRGMGFASVCLQPKQFSCWNNREWARAKLKTIPGRIRDTADDAWRFSAFSNITNGATHYHTTRIDPWWNKGMVHTITIKNHKFWKESDL